MSKELKLAIWVGLAAVVSWFVAKSTAASVKPVCAPTKTWKREKAKGDVWQKPVVSAPNAASAAEFPSAL